MDEAQIRSLFGAEVQGKILSVTFAQEGGVARVAFGDKESLLEGVATMDRASAHNLRKGKNAAGGPKQPQQRMSQAEVAGMRGSEAVMRGHRRASLQAASGGGGESKLPAAGGKRGPLAGLHEDDEEEEEDDEDEDDEDDEEYDGEIKLDDAEANRVTEEAKAAQTALAALADNVDAWTMVQDPTSRMFYYYSKKLLQPYSYRPAHVCLVLCIRVPST